MLDSQGHIVLIDFGLAKTDIKYKFKGGTSFCGSIAYLAPEMALKCGHGQILDYYLYGVLIYELIFGIPPFYNDNKETMLQNILSQPVHFPKKVSSELKSLLKGLLEKNPTRRLGNLKGISDVKQHKWFKNINWDRI